MKKILALMMCAVMVFALAACGSSGSSDSSSESASGGASSDVAAADLDDLTIAYLNVTDSLAPWPQYIKEDFQAICDENGWTLIGYDGQGDVNTQTDQVASVISDGEADLALLFCVDSEAGTTYVQDLTDAGIPVITFGSDVTEGDDGTAENVKCFVGPDQYELVNLVASYAIEQQGDEAQNYIVLAGWEGQYDYVARTAALEEIFADTQYTMVGDVQYCGASRDTAMESTTTLLTSNSDVDFIMALSDEFALGARQAVEEAGLNIPIYSVETFVETLPYIEDGSIAASVTMTSQAVADKLAEVIPSVMSGEEVDYQQSIDMELVTIDNAADYEDVLQY